jgi:hypothetical protein
MSIYQTFNGIPALPVDLDFDPVREPATRNGRVVEDTFWVVNPNSDAVMAVTKKKHNPTNFTHMWESFREGIAESDIDTSEIDIKFNVARNGSAFSADIVFKQYDYQRIVGEATQMKMRIIDSHDSTFRRDIRAMIMRLACTNGMVSVGEQLRVKQMHTMHSDPEKLGSVVSDFPTRLENEAHLYKEMMHTPVSKDLALQFARSHVATYRTAAGTKVNEKSVEEFGRIWNMYSGMGDTGYRLYNVLTHIGTHVTGREGTDMARKQIRIEDKVSDIVQTPVFRRLVGLAA